MILSKNIWIVLYAWRMGFPKAIVYHIATNKLDHLAILLDTDHEQEFLVRPFHFHSMWLRDEMCKEVVGSAWDVHINNLDAFQLVQKQKTIHKRLL